MFRSFKKNENGSILVMAAIIMPVLLLFVLVTLQYSLIRNARTEVQASLDVAMLAAAVEANNLESLDDPKLVEKTLASVFEPFLNANLSEDHYGTISDHEINYDASNHKVDVSVTFTHPSLVAMLSGHEDFEYTLTASTQLSGQERTALSMMLVLDKSGSMGWQGRMTALKQAVGELSDQFKLDDPDKKYIRLGAIAYDSSNYRYRIKPSWGPDSANRYTQSLRPGGGTNSSGAVNRAYRDLRNKREERQHKKRNSSELRKVILFMTDGANNRHSYNTSTLYYCRLAKRIGIQIYTVAFQAPYQGQKLLQSCASSSEHYFLANNARDLIAAFKMIGESALKDLAIAS